MKWLIVHPGPEFSVHDVFVGWSEALRALGQRVIDFNMNDRLCFYDLVYIKVSEEMMRKAVTTDQAVEMSVNGLYATLYKTRPDVLLVISGFLIPSDLLDLARAYGTKVVVMHTESPYEDARQVTLAEHADINLINDPINIDRFRAVARTEYLPQAYRPKLHCPGPAEPDLVSDLAFVGTGFRERIAFFEAMDLSGLNVLLGGNWRMTDDASPLRAHVAHNLTECLHNTDTVRVYRSARVGINLYRQDYDVEGAHAGWACGPREIEMAACGLFFLRDPRRESDELFPMLPSFTSPDEASEILRYWLAHDERRAVAARQARESIADRTFENHAAKLLRLLDKQPVTV